MQNIIMGYNGKLWLGLSKSVDQYKYIRKMTRTIDVEYSQVRQRRALHEHIPVLSHLLLI